MRPPRTHHVVAAAVVLLAAAQLIPVHRTNPPVESEVEAPPEVMALLRRACWDCHSNETVWGWHTYVAPISWLVTHDVNEGRGELNFSTWGALGARRLEKLHREIPEEVSDRAMPPWLYALAHPSARLSSGERAAVAAWGRTVAARGAASPLPADAAAPPGEEDEGEEGEEHGRRGRR